MHLRSHEGVSLIVHRYNANMSIEIYKCQSLDLSSPALAPIAGVNQLLSDRLQYADNEPFVHVYANIAGPAVRGSFI